MHNELKIYHRDIKPDNIVFSRKLKRLALIDFGLSVSKPESMYGRHFTGFCGTLKYMSEEMAGIKEDGEGYVDLANNDLVALSKSIEAIKEQNKDVTEEINFEVEYKRAG